MEQYGKDVRALRLAKKLHGVVEGRLAILLAKAFPGSAAVPEVLATLGGRNDLIQYFFDGRRVVFEVFCSKSQISQDLRLLEQCEAEVKIAVLIDADIDRGVSNGYFHKKPHAFPYIWLRWLMDPGWESIALARLRELIDEHHPVVRLREILAANPGSALDSTLRELIQKIEERLQVQAPAKPPDLSNKQVLALKIIELVRTKGVPLERLRSLFQWLCSSVEYAIEIAACGFQAFLVTDLESHHAIWSEGDLADDLIVFNVDIKRALVVISLNPLINEFFAATGLAPRKIRFHFVHSYAEFSGSTATEPSSKCEDVPKKKRSQPGGR